MSEWKMTLEKKLAIMQRRAEYAEAEVNKYKKKYMRLFDIDDDDLGYKSSLHYWDHGLFRNHYYWTHFT